MRATSSPGSWSTSPRPHVGTSKAATVAGYLAALPEPTRIEVSRVRDLVNDHLPRGYRDGMAFGMITRSIPLETYPDKSG